MADGETDRVEEIELEVVTEGKADNVTDEEPETVTEGDTDSVADSELEAEGVDKNVGTVGKAEEEGLNEDVAELVAVAETEDELEADGVGEIEGNIMHTVAPICCFVHVLSGQGRQLDEPLVSAYVSTGHGRQLDAPIIGPVVVGPVL